MSVKILWWLRWNVHELHSDWLEKDEEEDDDPAPKTTPNMTRTVKTDSMPSVQDCLASSSTTRHVAHPNVAWIP